MNYRLFIKIIAATAAVFSIFSCVNEEYEISEDRLDLNVNLFQEGLAVPLGSTDKIVVGDLIDKFYPDYKEYILDTDGVYAAGISKDIDLSDTLNNIKTMIDIPDVAFTQDIEFALNDIDVSDVAIDPMEYEYSQDLSDIVEVPEIEIPQITQESSYFAGLHKYVPENQSLALDPMSYSANFVKIESVNIPEMFRNDTPVPVEPGRLSSIPGVSLDLSTEISSATHSLSFEIVMPEGIKSVKDIVFSDDAKIVLGIELKNTLFSSGNFVPQLRLDLHEIFSLEGAENGILVTDFEIGAAGGRAVKELGVKSIVTDEDDWMTDSQGRLVLQKSVEIEVSGSIGYEDITTTTNLIAQAGGKETSIDVSLEFSDFQIADVTIEMEPVTQVWEYEVPFDLPSVTLPEGVKSVGSLTFAENTGIDVSLDVSNMIEGLDLSLESLEIVFPEEFEVKSADNGRLVLSDDNLRDGFNEKISVLSVSLPEPENGVISYNKTVQVKAVAGIGGCVSSSNLPQTDQEDLGLDFSFVSDLRLEDYLISVDGLGTELELAEELSVKLPSEIKEMGTFTITPEGNPAIDISIRLPEGIPVVTSAAGLKIEFPEMLNLGNMSSDYNYSPSDNSICIYGEIPESIQLPLESISVTPVTDPADNECYLKGTVKIAGGLAIPATDLTKADVDAVTAPGSGAYVKVSIPELRPSSLHLSSYSTSLEQEFEMELLKEGDVPAVLTSLEMIDLKDVFINISVDASALPDLGDADLSMNFEVGLPEEIVLQEGLREENGNLKVEGRLGDDGIIAVDPIKVEALNLSGIDLSKGLKKTVTVAGVISITDVSLEVDEWLGEGKSHNIKFEASINDIEVSKVSGKIDYQLEPIEEMLDVTGITDVIEDNNLNVEIDLSHVHLTAELNTNLNVSVAVDLELIPYSNGTPGSPVSLGIEVKGSDTSASVSSSKFWVGADAECCPAGYIFKQLDVMELLNPIPDSIQVKITGGTDPEALCVLEPDADYVLTAKCALDVPFEFGENMKVEFRDTIAVDADVIGLILEAGDLALIGNVESSLPFNINLEAVLLDKNNAEVEFAEGSGILNILGSHDGSPVNTDLEMMFAEKKGASVTEVGAVGLVFTLQSAADGARLGPDSYVKAELQALAPKGVSADLKDYINKE